MTISSADLIHPASRFTLMRLRLHNLVTSATTKSTELRPVAFLVLSSPTPNAVVGRRFGEQHIIRETLDAAAEIVRDRCDMDSATSAQRRRV